MSAQLNMLALTLHTRHSDHPDLLLVLKQGNAHDIVQYTASRYGSRSDATPRDRLLVQLYTDMRTLRGAPTFVMSVGTCSIKNDGEVGFCIHGRIAMPEIPRVQTGFD